MERWFERFQLWLLAHSVVRCVAGHPLDRHIRTAAQFLRLASADNPRWLAFVERLVAALPSQFVSINQYVVRQAQHMLANPEETERTELSALGKVGSCEIGEIQLEADADWNLPDFPGWQPVSDPKACPAEPPRWLIDDDLQLSAVLLEPQPNTDGTVQETLLGCDADPEENLTRQLGSAHTVLLLGREEAQFLPWSWQQMLPHEYAAVGSWINEASVDAPTKPQRLLAVLVWLAITTHRSLEQTLDIPISDNAAEDWVLSGACTDLRRRPPRPRSGWRAQPTHAELLASPCSELKISLPDWATSTLQAHTGAAAPSGTLRQYWPTNWASATSLFRDAAREAGFSRVMPSMLGRWLPTTLFAGGNDALFAAMACSRPNSGLPGATAYPSWSAGSVVDAYARCGVELRTDCEPESNALGSHLSPIDVALRQQLHSAGAKLRGRVAGGISFALKHNAFACHLVLLLLAATGSRPVTDPFESISHFDLDRGRVFIADKLAGVNRMGRLVPLPTSVTNYIRETYLPYLERLAENLKATRPWLAEQIRATQSLHAPRTMPFFFLLREDVSDWVSLSEKAIELEIGETFALPLNCFRHRYSQRLRHNGADPELIDSLLGHAYAGCVTHGDHSLRTWELDVQQLRPAIEGLFADLDVQWPEPPSIDAEALPLRPSAHSGGAIRNFGLAAREEAQRQRQTIGRRQARQVMEKHLRGRELHQLDDEEINSLERELLFMPGGLPHALGGLRYRFYLRVAQRVARRKSVHLKRRRVYVPLNEEVPFFRESAVWAQQGRDMLREGLPRLRRFKPPAKASVADAALMCALHLAVESRLSNPKILWALERPGATRLIFHQRRYWLEFLPNVTVDEAEDEPRSDRAPTGAPTIRLPMSRSAATYFSRLRAKKGRHQSDNALLERISDLLIDAGARHEGYNTRDIVAAFTEVTDQANAIELPGALAAFLAGRVASYSLGWHDLVRVDTGKFLALPCEGEDETWHDLAMVEREAKVAPTDRPALQQRVHAFFRALREHLEASDTGPRTHARRDLVGKLRWELKRCSPDLPSAIRIAGAWVAHLAATVSKLSSVRRYFNTLSGAIEDVWYDEELVGADEEELTELYRQILEVRTDRDLSIVGKQLHRFHAFAREHFALVEPYWDELPIPPRGAQVSAGYIRETDYVRALALLSKRALPAGEQCIACSILILCYRFGLRAGEAFALQREDWVELGAETYIAVRNNRHRKLKTQASRRLVPLLFDLTEPERTSIKQALATSEADAGDTAAAPLLGAASVSGARRRVIHREIIRALRQATTSPSTTLHHARHTFAMRVLDGLLSGYPSYRSVLPDPSPHAIAHHLLGAPGSTRRTLWALARILGHAGPSTTLTSYIHVLDRWAESFADPAVRRPVKHRMLACDDLDSLPRQRGSLHTPEAPTPRSPGCRDLLRLLRLLARGTPWQAASRHLDLEESGCARIYQALLCISRHHSTPKISNEEAARLLLGAVTEEQWKALLSCAERIDALCPAWPSDLEAPTSASVASLISRQRQVLLAKPAHFVWMRLFLDAATIDGSHYELTATAPEHPNLREYAKEQQFTIRPRTDVTKGGNPFQIDPLTLDDGFSTVSHRCALIFKENRSFAIRNRIGFALLLLCWAEGGAKTAGKSPFKSAHSS
ncbi:hypothetical protein [Aromatoleum evansii]|uniref:hypothetical protein n=1 Tax=Aromatoleum evansii TaxID=59406 RepID=UPI00145D8EB0|nr:hypothetical protein [Aromatoleum evansii]NMG27956.1 tyrosine-type recombinase/integrase [Aromatoleum evansii]